MVTEGSTEKNKCQSSRWLLVQSLPLAKQYLKYFNCYIWLLMVNTWWALLYIQKGKRKKCKWASGDLFIYFIYFYLNYLTYDVKQRKQKSRKTTRQKKNPSSSYRNKENISQVFTLTDPWNRPPQLFQSLTTKATRSSAKLSNRGENHYNNIVNKLSLLNMQTVLFMYLFIKLIWCI